MKENEKIIEYKGKKYELIFNLNVMNKIQEEYETLNNWGSLTDGSKGEPNLKALIFGLTEMINEAIDINNEDNNLNEELLTTKKVGRILSEIGMQEVASKIQNVVIDSTQSQSKN